MDITNDRSKRGGFTLTVIVGVIALAPTLTHARGPDPSDPAAIRTLSARSAVKPPPAAPPPGNPVAGAPQNDNCENATTISGAGPHDFNLINASTDGEPEAVCMSFGTSQIEQDVWYRWTAGCTPGQFATISLCGNPAIDTRVAVYVGETCTAATACNDDFCGLQSSITWAAITGQVYTIRLGTFPGASAGTGTFTIECAAFGAPQCTALNPATDCQETHFDIAYNISQFSVAESVSANEPVNSICIRGIYFRSAPVADSFTLNVYDTLANGAAGPLIDSFTQTSGMVVSPPARTGAGFLGRDVYEWNFSLARPVDHHGRCLWYEFRNNASGDSMFWLDGNASNGDHQAGPIGGPPASDDMSICINGGFVNNQRCLIGAPPCCDVNNDAVINSSDFFDFLTPFFNAAPEADFNRDRFVNSQDFFDLLSCLFTPPPGCP